MEGFNFDALLAGLKANWQVSTVVAIVFLLIPSPVLSWWKKIAKKIGLKLNDSQSDRIISFLDAIRDGLKESQFENNDGHIPEAAVTKALAQVEEAKREVEKIAEENEKAAE